MQKTTIVEYKRYIDAETGEIFEVPVIKHEMPKNSDFEMIFYGHLLEILGELGNKKIKILEYIMRKKDKHNNSIIITIAEISKNLKISLGTVKNTLSFLEDKDVIRRRTGAIFINPDVICDGRFKDKIMHVYGEAAVEETEELRTARLEREIKRQEKELRALKALRSNTEKMQKV